MKVFPTQFATLRLLIILSIMDGVMTYLGICRWGIRIEGNPWVRCFLETYGAASGLFTLKIAVIASLLWLLRQKDIKVFIPLCVVMLFYFGVIMEWILALTGVIQVI